MTPEKANNTDDLKKILALISFEESCVDFDWDWTIQELLDLKTASYPDPDTERSHKLVPVKTLTGWLINTKFKRPDINSGEIGEGEGRKLFIQVGASASSVFFTCWVAVDLIVRHELMEAIRFDGKRVLNPHHTLEELSLPDMLKNWPSKKISVKDLKETLEEAYGIEESPDRE